MKSKFIVTVAIDVTHDKETFIDENSIKGLLGSMISAGRSRPIGCLCEVGDKTEGPPETFNVTLIDLTEAGEGPIDLSDFEDYIKKAKKA